MRDKHQHETFGPTRVFDLEADLFSLEFGVSVDPTGEEPHWSDLVPQIPLPGL